MVDLVIRNAVVVDGTGGEIRRVDVAVDKGRIAAVGVTTVVIGNCGFGIAPATPDTWDLIPANLSEVEAMSLDSLKAGVHWDFETFPEYLDALRRKGVVPNVASFASHSAIRSVVMKEAGSERGATEEELEQMVRIFRDAMAAGAIGLGSSTFENHNGAGGVPVPSRLATDEEFLAFAKVMAEFKRGLTVMTCGDRTSIEFLEQLASASGRPAIYAPLLHYSNQPHRAAGIAEQCRQARERGALVYTQASCQPLSMDFKLEHAYPLMTVRPWPELANLDHAAFSQAISADSFRDRMRQSLSRPEGGRIFNGDWSRVEVTIAATPANRGLEGRTIAQVAAERGADPVDVFLDIGLQEDLETTFTAKLLNVEEDRVGALLEDDGNLVSLSDGGAHLTFFCDAGFGVHFLGHWARELGRFELSRALRKLTSDVAEIYGLEGRGRIEVGAHADMILFDRDTIKISKTHRVSDLPGGATRLMRTAPGRHTVWVNGVRVYDQGEYVHNPRPPGHVITQFSESRPSVGMPVAESAKAG